MKSKQKIFSLNNFNLNIKKKNLKIVQCHGVFDLLHIGHIRHFNKAKSYGDILVVSITSDKFVKKGYNRPYFNEKLRSEALAALDCVDFVVISNSASAVKAINKIKPKIFCKGQDYKKLNKDITGKIYKEKKAIEKIGGKIVFTNDLTFSSSTLINNSFEIFDNDQKETE